MSNTPQPRPYEPEELEGLKKDALVELVLAQKECWPHNENGRNVTAMQIRRDTLVSDLRNELLNKTNGFTTTQPLRVSVPGTQPQVASCGGTTGAPSSSPIPGNGLLITGGDIAFLSVFVQDTRASAETKGEVATFSVPCLMNIGCTEVRKRVPVRISALDVIQQHAMYSGYQVTFASSFDPENPEGTAYSPPLLQFPPNGHLFLAASGQQTSSAQGQDDSEEKNTASQHKAKEGMRQLVVDWLKERLHEKSSYIQFRKNCRCVLQNPEIVEQWAFISKFSQEYRGRRPIPGKRRLCVTQIELARALGYPRSTLKAALAAYEIVKDCGVGGKKESQAVINELERTDNPQDGAQALIKFLQSFTIAA
ncbi:hypothetical protein V5O48_010558 [Marasmius crinis-equi]|uniref:Uncharacterized protein n=1 Tax=Marasmius crinis-equi TaxID=585013 RepID=A0ABR3F8I4_9AGAR